MSVIIPKSLFRGKVARRAFLAFLEQWIAAPQSGKWFNELNRTASPWWGLCKSWQCYRDNQPLEVHYATPYLLLDLFEANGLDRYYPFNGGRPYAYSCEKNRLRHPKRRAFVKACIAALREELA